MKNDFIYVPSIKLHVAKERTHYDKNWFRAHKALEGPRTLTLPEFVNFLNYLRENPSEENNKIFNDITKERSPCRSEWLDAYFEQRKGGLYILTGNRTKAEKLEEYLTEKRLLGISFNDWLKNPTSQGLPRLKISEGDLDYRCPKDTRVARFVADFDKVRLDCDANPFGSDPGIGVRTVKQL